MKGPGRVTSGSLDTTSNDLVVSGHHVKYQNNPEIREFPFDVFLF